MFDVDLASVKAYHHHLNLVAIPHEYFVRPILRFMFVVTRAMTKAQKYRRNAMAFDLPVTTFQAKWIQRFPVCDKRLGFNRQVPYESIQTVASSTTARLLPTETTPRLEIWEYTIPAGRPALISGYFALEEFNRRRAWGNCKLWLPSGRAQRQGAKAKGLWVACGPLWVRYATPLSKPGVGRLKATWWTGRFDFETFEFRYPEQTGSETRPSNNYTTAQKVVIRDHTMRTLWLMLQRPQLYRNAFPDGLKQRVAKALRIDVP